MWQIIRPSRNDPCRKTLDSITRMMDAKGLDLAFNCPGIAVLSHIILVSVLGIVEDIHII